MKRASGFTLIELMVVVAIVAIIATIAIPSFSEQLAKSRRSDALRGLGELMLKQEKYRGNHTSYGTCDQILNPGTCAAYNAAAVSPYYDFAVSNITPNRYVLTATPKAGSAQAGDRCGTFTFTMNNGTLTKAAGGGATCL